jgi:transcription initiation factor IIF auxiliary subunit
MTNFPDPSSKKCQELFEKSKDGLFELAAQMKIDNLSEDFLKEIVIPISYHLHNSFSKRKTPFLICFTGWSGVWQNYAIFFYTKSPH